MGDTARRGGGYFFCCSVYKLRFSQSRLRLPFGVVLAFEPGAVSGTWWSMVESRGFQKASLLRADVDVLWRFKLFMVMFMFMSGWKLEKGVSISTGAELERWWLLERRCWGMEGEEVFGMGMSWGLRGVMMLSEFFLLEAATLAV